MEIETKIFDSYFAGQQPQAEQQSTVAA